MLEASKIRMFDYSFFVTNLNFERYVEYLQVFISCISTKKNKSSSISEALDDNSCNLTSIILI